MCCYGAARVALCITIRSLYLPFATFWKNKPWTFAKLYILYFSHYTFWKVCYHHMVFMRGITYSSRTHLIISVLLDALLWKKKVLFITCYTKFRLFMLSFFRWDFHIDQYCSTICYSHTVNMHLDEHVCDCATGFVHACLWVTVRVDIQWKWMENVELDWVCWPVCWSSFSWCAPECVCVFIASSWLGPSLRQRP